MQALNFHSGSIQDLEKNLEKHTVGSFSPTLAFVFSSVAHSVDKITDVFKKHHIALVGCTTAGEFVNDEVSQEGISTMLLDMDKSYYRVFLEKGANTKELAEQATKKAISHFNDPALIVLSSGLAVNGDDIITGVNQVGRFPLFGGLAGDDFKMQGSYVFTENDKSDNALLFLAVDSEKMLVTGLATSGWKAVGTPKIATKAEGNILYTIDDEPALDVFLKYFKLPVPTDRKKDVIAEVGMKYPLQIERDGYKTLRAPLMANDDGALVLAGEIPQGASMYFSMPPDFDVIDQSVEDLASLKDEVPHADAMVLVSCIARHLALGPMIGGELNGLHELWKAPLVGFFSYGEIGTINGASVCDLHNETVSLILFKEK